MTNTDAAGAAGETVAAPPTEPTIDPPPTTGDTPDTPAETPAEESPIPELPPTFAELGARPETAEALARDGIERAFPIQAQTLPLAMSGGDVIGQAKTGTGKTLGFGVPILQRIVAPGDPEDTLTLPQALIVAPTRELAIQVAGDLEKAGRLRQVRVAQIYGGRGYEPQIEALRRGVEIVVGTPGRLIDLINQGHLDLSELKVLVLDEADEMLDMGFLPDVERIVDKVPSTRQTMLFSATMPGRIVSLARRYMNRPTHIRAADVGDEAETVDAIEQHVWRAHPMDKVEILARILQAKDRGLTLVFTRTKRKAQKISDDLASRGFAAASVHGDLGQGAREQALRAFRKGKVDVLVATDVAARGIDITGITHVVNYECPDDEKTYVHRIGRTGRAGESGTAVTLVDWEDINRWQMIDRALKLPFADPIETYSTSDHLYTGMEIPQGATGRLPRSARTRAGLDAEEIEDLHETGKAAGSRPKQRQGNRSGGGDRQGDRRQGSRGSGGSRGRSQGSSGRSGGGRNDADREGGREQSGGSSNRSSTTEKDGSTRRRRRRRRPSGKGSGSGSGS